MYEYELVAWERRIKYGPTGKWSPWQYFTAAVDFNNDPTKFPARVGRWDCEYRGLFAQVLVEG